MPWINLSSPRDRPAAEAEAGTTEAVRMTLTCRPASPAARGLVLADEGYTAKR